MNRGIQINVSDSTDTLPHLPEENLTGIPADAGWFKSKTHLPEALFDAFGISSSHSKSLSGLPEADVRELENLHNSSGTARNSFTQCP